jgi:hypothetical protein
MGLHVGAHRVGDKKACGFPTGLYRIFQQEAGIFLYRLEGRMVHDFPAILVEPTLTERVLCTCIEFFRI